MRIKWNRHLDGSASRQAEDGSPTQETDEKKKTSSASPGIFKIFRRKKKNRHAEEDEKAGGHPATDVLQEEAVDDECASISSIATCASQPVSDGFKRDRASSLFSSFRLSLPGSKRKKRRIAPAPSDTILNGQQQQNEPQTERYSTPDLRKPSDNLVSPSDQQVTHSTSSPSIRHPKEASTSAQSLDVIQNSESLDKLKLNGAKSNSSIKLSKSVSFSSCRGSPIDSPYSKCDIRDPRAVNSVVAMVEENCGAVESELPTCMSDNLRESKLTSFADSSTIEAQSLPRCQNRLAGALVDTVEMTKTKKVVGSGTIQDCNISRIDNILSNIVSEICTYDKNNEVGTSRVNQLTSSFNCASRSQLGVYDNKAAASSVQEDTNDERYAVRANSKTPPGVHHVEETRCVTSPVSEWNTICETFDNNNCDIVLPSEVNENATYHYDSNHLQSEVPFNKNLHLLSVAKLPIVAPTKILSNSCESTQNRDLNIDDIMCDLGKAIECGRTVIEKRDNDVVSQTAIEKDKHVVCHMKVYHDGRGKSKSDDSICTNSYYSEDSSTKSLCDKFVQKMHSIDNSLDSSSNKNKPVDSKNTQPSYVSTLTSSSDSQKYSSVLKNNSNDRASYRTNSALNQSDFDQKVPDLSCYNNNIKNDHEVPEFELSLLEFEEMCDKYMSGKNVQFSDCASAFSHFNDSPRRKSVLDLNQPFIFSPFRENGDSKTHLNHVEDDMSSVLSAHSDRSIGRSIEICSDSSSPDLKPTEKSPLPLPPKQWISCLKPIPNERNRDVCIDREQCTAVRGKNLCQESSLGAFPTTVMHGEPGSGGIDTPQLSSTLETFENKSGRQCSSIDSVEKQVSDTPTPPEDIVSNVGPTLVSSIRVTPAEDTMAKVGMTISNLNSVLDYSCAETPSKDSAYLNPEIRDTFRLQRGICDPLIYCADRTKGLETLGSENYLIGHNFSGVGLCEVISEVSCDSVQSGSRLIEISNPYEDESFVVPREMFSSNLMNGLSVSVRNNNSNNGQYGSSCELKSSSDANAAQEITYPRNNTNAEKETLINKISEEEKVLPTNDVARSIINCNRNKSLAFVVNGNGLSKENKLSYSKQKNLINKHKSSMIPCRKKGPRDAEIKRLETKQKSKKADTIPKFSKSESIPVKNNSSLRDLSQCYKDPDVGHNSKQKSHLFVKLCEKSNLSPVTSINSETGSEVNHSNSEATPGQDSGYYAADDSKISRLYSRRTSELSNCSNFDSKSESSSITIDLDSSADKNELDDSESVHSFVLITPEISSRFGFDDRSALPSNGVKSNGAVPAHHEWDSKFVDEFYSGCVHSNMNGDGYAETPSECSESTTNTKSLDINLHPRRSSLPVVCMVKRSFASSKESLNSQLTNSSYRGKSRIPTKQPSSRGAQPSSKGPVRPPMWLSKAELTQEIQRLGTLCEARTKELNRLKMETKHVSVGFDAFAALFKYMVEDLNALSVPNLTKDLEKTLKQLELTKQDLAFYEREVEEIKSHHCQELNDLSNKLFEVYQSEVAELNAKHQEEINHLKNDHQKQIEHVTTTFDVTSAEVKSHQEKMVASLEQEIVNQRAELQLLQEREIRDLEEKHAEGTKMLQEHVEQLQKKCAELKQHSMSMEDAMRKDTDSKLQWVSSAKLDLEKEVESLKAVLEMKNKELHILRVQNLEMEKQLEELPIAREKIKMLQARAEDLEALMIEKTKIERKLSTENQQMRDTYEKEAKVNKRLSMENEELQWRLRQAENSIISGSFSEVPEFPEAEENLASPIKSPGPQILSRSVFFTFMDKDESMPHSPRTQYKKITPNFSNNYKTSPAKSSKSPPIPSPQRRAKSHSEPPQPIITTSTPRKNAKLPLSKNKGPQKRQRSGSDIGRQAGELTEGGSSSVADSMASSISSESSVFEHRERLLEEHKEHIIHSLEILREQRSIEMSADEVTMIEKKWRSDDIKVTGELSTLETEDMSRSAEFADPKTYYHMTFPVLKEAGDIEDCCKNPSSGNSPVKEVMSRAKHSKSVDNINSSVAADVQVMMSMSTQESSMNNFMGTDVQVMSMSMQEASSTNNFIDADVQNMHSTKVSTGADVHMSMSMQEVSSTVRVSAHKRNSCTELTVSAENVQKEDTSSNIADSQWRTI